MSALELSIDELKNSINELKNSIDKLKNTPSNAEFDGVF
jgi:prefoldin subunit 5